MSRKTDLADRDNPEWSEADFARAESAQSLPEHVKAAFRRPPGRPRSPSPKPVVSIRLDPDVLAYFKSTGPGWQTRINDILAREAGKG